MEKDESKLNRLVNVQGHPLNTFARENIILKGRINLVRKAMAEGTSVREALNEIQGVAVHYEKKGDLLYPHLKAKYGIASDEMWTEDDEICEELALFFREEELTSEKLECLEKLLARMEEMIERENSGLLKDCADHFDTGDWVNLYHDAKPYPVCFGVRPGVWKMAELAEFVVENATPEDMEICIRGGHMTVAQLRAILNALPLEISFIDDQNINRFFNEGPKMIKRPEMAIDREVFACHPPKAEPRVRKILDSFREGTMDSIPVWMEKDGKPLLITYLAVRDKAGKYLGTLELVQDMTCAKEHFEQKNQLSDEA